MSKLRTQLLKTCQALQLHFDIKETMADVEAEESQKDQVAAAVTEDFNSFTDFLAQMVIEPFGGRIF